jgi:hypothetical protein
MTCDRRLKQEKQLILPLGQVPDRRREPRHVAVLLTLDHGGRMLASGCQVRAVVRALDLDQPFGATADGADRLTQCGAVTTTLARTTGGAGHISASHT